MRLMTWIEKQCANLLTRNQLRDYEQGCLYEPMVLVGEEIVSARIVEFTHTTSQKMGRCYD
jgi:hypothetical protein